MLPARVSSRHSSCSARWVVCYLQVQHRINNCNNFDLCLFGHLVELAQSRSNYGPSQSTDCYYLSTRLTHTCPFKCPVYGTLCQSYLWVYIRSLPAFSRGQAVTVATSDSGDAVCHFWLRDRLQTLHQFGYMAGQPLPHPDNATGKL